MAKQSIPITPEVLRWVLGESGFGLEEVAAHLKVSVEDLQDWQFGRSAPGFTQLKKLAAKVHRPVATFLLPRPPRREGPVVEFRHPPGTEHRTLSPVERRYIRRASRLQRILAWISGELNEPRTRIVTTRIEEPPASAALATRAQLNIAESDQLRWLSTSAAFDEWRARLEELGILVFLFPLGKKSCRGFSLWNERAPVIAVNTAWNDAARIFTLFHELGHLVTRTNSACTEGVVAHSQNVDSVERWCERFAAEVLMPKDLITAEIRQRFGSKAAFSDVQEVAWLAHRLKTSLRAATIRLIELGLASWEFYGDLPPTGDAKRPGGGGTGRVRREIREDELGRKTAVLFKRAVSADVIAPTQALPYLDISHADFEHVEQPAG